MRTNPIIIIITALVLGCGGSQKAEPAEPSPDIADVAAEGHLHLAAMKIVEVSTGEAIHLHEDGHVEVQGQIVGTLHADGRFVLADGQEVARLHEDGRVSGDEGLDEEQLTIAADGALQKAGAGVVTLDAEGLLSAVDGDAGPKIKFEGPSEGRRAAMFVFLLATMPGEVKESGASEVEASEVEAPAVEP